MITLIAQNGVKQFTCYLFVFSFLIKLKARHLRQSHQAMLRYILMSLTLIKFMSL